MNGLQAKLDEALLKEREKERVRSGMYSPHLLGRCYRAQYWNRQGIEPSNPPDTRALRVFKCGELFHRFVQDLLPEHQAEVEATDGENFYGKADIVCEGEVIDLKSQHSKAFWWMAKSNYDISEEKKPNILQLMCYCWLLGKPRGRLVFISKDDLCVNEYVFEYDKWREKLQEEIDTLKMYWEKQELPKAEPRAYGGKEGTYCSFKTKCLRMGWDCVNGKNLDKHSKLCDKKEIEDGHQPNTDREPCPNSKQVPRGRGGEVNLATGERTSEFAGSQAGPFV